ncbi:MAG: Hsp20/alpha crystallin family protein [Thermoproteota archaeon]|nr:Hsp20/alpha crystallin family protein [Candidatus Brockarchaeota archaeon]MBO3768202.1 Hsp20/alpha crystallin family protein [Candidatus Brockarchaeota archaeon]MBO3801650.1 Hsp20/alpha crystallin family protein [Candidatus Brockarchaeota archaeon]
MSEDFFYDFMKELRSLIRKAREEEEEIMREIKQFEERENCIVPLYEVNETPEEYIVTVDLPGVEKEKIDLRISERKMYVKAPCSSIVTRRRASNKPLNYVLEVSLPEEIDVKNVRAKFKNGVLIINLRKIGKGFTIKVE